jgi:RsiW-degrading membrane proteinase PrsW (M82 family)
MSQQSLSNDRKSSGTPPTKSWLLRILLWAIVGAALGALWAFFHYGTEGWNGPVMVLAIAFGVAGGLLSLVVSNSCRT